MISSVSILYLLGYEFSSQIYLGENFMIKRFSLSPQFFFVFEMQVQYVTKYHQQLKWVGPIAMIFFNWVVLMPLFVINRCMKLQLWGVLVFGTRSRAFLHALY